MKNRYQITSYQDLIETKSRLKTDILFEENQIKNNSFFKLSNSFFNTKGHLKQTLTDAIPSLQIKNIISGPVGNILTTFLMANRYTRKYFVTVIMASQLLPFLLDKASDLIASDKRKA